MLCSLVWVLGDAGRETPVDHPVIPGPAPRDQNPGIEIDVLSDRIVEATGWMPHFEPPPLAQARPVTRAPSPGDILDLVESNAGPRTEDETRRLTETTLAGAQPSPGPAAGPPQYYSAPRLTAAVFDPTSPSSGVILTFDAPTKFAYDQGRGVLEDSLFEPCSKVLKKGLGTLGSGADCL